MSEPIRTPPSRDAFLAAIVESSSDAILTKDLNGIITSWNPGAERIFGYRAEEVIGRPVTLLFPPDRVDEEPAILERIRRGEQIGHYETVRRRKDGGLLDVSLTVSPIRNSEGVIIGASKIARDITAQKQAQELSRVTLASITDTVISTDSKGRILFMNAAAERLTGWLLAEIQGHPVEAVCRLVQEGNRSAYPSPRAAILQEGRTSAHVSGALLVARDGSETAVEGTAAPIRRASGALGGCVLVLRAVGDKRDAELASIRLAAIIEGTDDAIVGKDLRGIVTNWNPGAERLFGYSEKEMVGQSITKIIPQDRLPEEQEILARLKRGDRVDHFQTVRRRKDGTLVHVSLTISAIRDASGRIVGASKIARDVTALRDAQRKLEMHASELETKVRERTAKLEETVVELEAFSYSLSHDMRAPLRAIQSFSEIVLTDFGDKLGEGADYLRRVVAAASRMDRLIQDVLAFARLNRAEIAVGTLDVEQLVDGIVRERPELAEPHVSIKIDRPLPKVIGHDACLTQCLTNLLDNAAKFVFPGSKPQISIFAVEHDGWVRLCVRDNGIGIEPDVQHRLFAIFQRLPTVERYQGTGLGLAIVRKAAERMNGRVGVDSLAGKGSTFWIELPKAPE